MNNTKYAKNDFLKFFYDNFKFGRRHNHDVGSKKFYKLYKDKLSSLLMVFHRMSYYDGGFYCNLYYDDDYPDGALVPDTVIDFSKENHNLLISIEDKLSEMEKEGINEDAFLQLCEDFKNIYKNHTMYDEFLITEIRKSNNNEEDLDAD